jgi:hypothetical protein
MFPNNRLIAILAFPCSATRSNALRHHLGGESPEKLKSALKILSITADHAMLQPTLLKVADIVNDRLDTSRERESAAFATLLLGSDTAVNGENCAHNLTRIAKGPCRLGTHFHKRVAIKLRSIEGMRGLAATGYQPLPSRPARLRAPSTFPQPKLAHAVAAPISERIAACRKPRTVLV